MIKLIKWALIICAVIILVCFFWKQAKNIGRKMLQELI